MNRALWMIGQALAVGGLTWFFLTVPLSPGETERPNPIFLFVMSIIIVAFATAVIVNLWDWALRPFRRRASVGHGDEPPQDRIRASRPRLSGGQMSEEWRCGRIGQQPRDL